MGQEMSTENGDHRQAQQSDAGSSRRSYSPLPREDHPLNKSHPIDREDEEDDLPEAQRQQLPATQPPPRLEPFSSPPPPQKKTKRRRSARNSSAAGDDNDTDMFSSQPTLPMGSLSQPSAAPLKVKKGRRSRPSPTNEWEDSFVAPMPEERPKRKKIKRPSMGDSSQQLQVEVAQTPEPVPEQPAPEPQPAQAEEEDDNELLEGVNGLMKAEPPDDDDVVNGSRYSSFQPGRSESRALDYHSSQSPRVESHDSSVALGNHDDSNTKAPPPESDDEMDNNDNVKAPPPQASRASSHESDSESEHSVAETEPSIKPEPASDEDDRMDVDDVSDHDSDSEDSQSGSEEGSGSENNEEEESPELDTKQATGEATLKVGDEHAASGSEGEGEEDEEEEGDEEDEEEEGDEEEEEELPVKTEEESALASTVNSPSPSQTCSSDLEEEHDVLAEVAAEETSPQPSPSPSPKPPGSHLTTKRKTKVPFFAEDAGENAEAFAEPPPEEAAVTPRPPRRRKLPTARPTATAASSASKTPQAKALSVQQRKSPAKKQAASEDGESGQPQYRKGLLSVLEQQKVNTAIQNFRSEHGFTQQEVNAIIHENPQGGGQDKSLHRELWAQVAEQCPTRPRRKLMEWCRQRYHNFVARGTWTKEQDEELRELVDIHGTKWADIAALINRHRRDVRDRWRNYLVCRDNLKTDYWDDDEEERLTTVVHAAVERIKEELGKNGSHMSTQAAEELINWAKISEAMGHTRSRLQCVEKWKRLRAAEPIPDRDLIMTVLPDTSHWRVQKARKDLTLITPSDKYKLVKAIRDAAPERESEIKWKDIYENLFEKEFERQALVVVWGRLRQSVPEWEDKTTYECAEHICEMYEKEGVLATWPDEEEDAEVGGGAGSKKRKRKATPRPSAKKRRAPRVQKPKASSPTPKAAKASSRATSRRESKTPALAVDSDSEEDDIDPYAPPIDEDEEEEEAPTPKATKAAKKTSSRATSRRASKTPAVAVDSDSDSEDIDPDAPPIDEDDGEEEKEKKPKSEAEEATHENIEMENNKSPAAASESEAENEEEANASSSDSSSEDEPEQENSILHLAPQLDEPSILDQSVEGSPSVEAQTARTKKRREGTASAKGSPNGLKRPLPANSDDEVELPSQSQPNKRKKQSQMTPAPAAQEDNGDLSSDMEDMEDIPSTLPTMMPTPSNMMAASPGAKWSSAAGKSNNQRMYGRTTRSGRVSRSTRAY
ncbi:hypothetical protein QBC35DRAFT_484914 [Podospora australis]|uniref:DNA-binding protein n=1 Tax=Podospora australis TaxID=1536484 RepID=A0AAN6X1G2_9PEZI|nr:hypothetical protein QBC35DRAFT_484914 [Podospora australis]